MFRLFSAVVPKSVRSWFTQPASRRPCQPRRVRPGVESLEERVVPNAAPVVADLAEVSVVHGHTVLLDLSAQASDADGDPLTVRIALNPMHGYVSAGATAGQYVYHSYSNYLGTDSLSFTANDGTLDSNSGIATFDLTDNAPVVVNPAVVSVAHGHSATFDLATSASDADGDPLSLSIMTQPAHGYLYAEYGTGRYVYASYGNYLGTDSAIFRANDGALDSNTATVSFNVTDQAPVAADPGGLSVLHGHSMDLSPATLATDADGDALLLSVVQGPAHGYAYYNTYTGLFTYGNYGTFVGTDTFTVKANDGLLDSNVATLSIAVTDTAPVLADPGTFTVRHDHGLELNLAALASDADHDGTNISVVQPPAHGSLYYNYYTGLYTYTPNIGFVGADSATLKANDGALDSNVGTLTITVTDQAPTVSDLSVTVPHGHTGEVNLAATAADPDSGDWTSVSVVQQPAHGSLYYNYYTGLYNYTPNYGFVGADTTNYQATDGALTSNLGTATFTVTDTAPTVQDFTVSVLQGQTAVIDLAGTASDADSGDWPSVSVVQGPSHGYLYQDWYTGQYHYQPYWGYVGADSVTFKATDGALDSNSGTVTIHVTPTPPSITSVLIDNYADNYSGVDAADTADDVVTAQLEVNNPNGVSVTYQYVWTVGGQAVQTDTTDSVVDTLDLSLLGVGYSGVSVGVSVTLVGWGEVASTANIGTQNARPAIVWATAPTPPGFAGPLAPPAAPNVVIPGGAANYTFDGSEGAPQDMLIGQVQAASTSGNPVSFAIMAGNTGGRFKIDGSGRITVAPESLPLVATVIYHLTLTAADSANPGLPANQRPVGVTIRLWPTVVITGDFQGVVAPIGGGADNITLQFVRVANDLSGAITALYTIDWNGINAANAFSDPANLANTLPNVGTVTFAANQQVVNVTLTPRAVYYAGGRAQFNVRLDEPGANDGYIIPPHDSEFFIPSLVMTGFDNADVFIYDGTCLFASNNGTPGLADPGDAVNLNDIAQGKIGDCYFLAAVGALANSNPQSIRDFITDNGNGTATVFFFTAAGQAATPVTVSMTLDKGFSQAKLSGDYRMSADNSHREWEIWPQVLEKAYARFLVGGWQTLNNGGRPYVVWQQLTQLGASSMTTTGLTATTLATALYSLLDNNQMVVVDSKTTLANPVVAVEGLNYEVVTNHSYVLLRIWQDNGNDIMELYNPWGGDPDDPDNTTNRNGPIEKPIIEVPLASFNTFFSRFQWQ